MNKSIIFAVIAFAAVVAAAPKPGVYSPAYPAVSYAAPIYAHPVAYNVPSSAAAKASAYASAPNAGYLYNVNSYNLLGGNSGYSYGHNPVYGPY